MQPVLPDMKSFIATVIALGILGIAADASAYCRSTTCRTTADHECETDDNNCPIEGAKLFWPTSCVGFSFNQDATQDLDPDETFATLRKCFAAWTQVTCPGGGQASITLQEGPLVACHKSEYNKSGPNVNVILFQDDDWQYRTIDATLAKTSVTYNDDTGEIYDADIEINTANNDMTLDLPPAHVSYDLQSIITHEAGHFIGIAHSPDDDAIMAPTYSPGSIKRDLTADDIGAVCEIYPPNSGVVCNPTPRGGFSGTCDDPPAKKGLCAASPPPAQTGGAGTTALLGMLGVVGLVLARRLRRNEI